MTRRGRLLFILAAVGLTGGGCGSRTGMLDPYAASGEGGGSGVGATAGVGGGGTGGVSGIGGVSGTGGVGGTGGTPSCGTPTCSGCPTCMSLCTCKGESASVCQVVCGSGGTGGVSGFGGVGGGPTCAPPSCNGCQGCEAMCVCHGGSPGACQQACGIGPCCLPTGTKGCSDLNIANCVCQKDKYCCNTAWDSACVNEVNTLGCGQCNTGGTGGVGGFGGGGGVSGFGGVGGGFGGTGGAPGVICGGQVCGPVDFHGLVLPACCPPTNPNTCGGQMGPLGIPGTPQGCVALHQPGVPDPSCPPVGPFPGCCKPSGLCGDDFGASSLGCVDTSLYYGGPPEQKCGGVGGAGGFGGAGGLAGAGGVAGAGGSGGASGSCCAQQSGPFCSDPAIANCVCQKDKYCCQQRWDQICVNEVTSFGCGACPGAGGSGGASGGAGGSAGAGGVAGTGGVAGGGGTGGVGQCVAQSKTACEACACQSCFSQLGACVGDFGCPQIVACVQKTGCTGLNCYQASTCKSVIDNFGGPTGTSMQDAIQLAICALQGGCPCP